MKKCDSGRSIIAENVNGNYFRCMKKTACEDFIDVVKDAQVCASAKDCRGNDKYGYFALGTCNESAPDLVDGHFNVTYKDDEIYVCQYEYPYLDVTAVPFKCVSADNCHGYLDRNKMLCTTIEQCTSMYSGYGHLTDVQKRCLTEEQCLEDPNRFTNRTSGYCEEYPSCGGYVLDDATCVSKEECINEHFKYTYEESEIKRCISEAECAKLGYKVDSLTGRCVNTAVCSGYLLLNGTCISVAQCTDVEHDGYMLSGTVEHCLSY